MHLYATVFVLLFSVRFFLLAPRVFVVYGFVLKFKLQRLNLFTNRKTEKVNGKTKIKLTKKCLYNNAYQDKRNTKQTELS